MDAQIDSLQLAVQMALYGVLSQLATYVPRILAALLIIFVGNMLGTWFKWLVIRVVRTMGIAQVLRGSPVEKFLEQAEFAKKAEEFVGDLFKFLLLLIAFIAAVNVLGLTTVSLFLSNILTYVPKVLAAILILVVGILIAGFVEGLVKGSLAQISLSSARLLSKVSSYIIMVFSVMAALAQLGIAENLIYILFIGFVAMLALGFGLAFGLGAKELVAKILDEWYTKLKKDNP